MCFILFIRYTIVMQIFKYKKKNISENKKLKLKQL